ncbi:MAG: glycerol-3-phosphate dehydrogenase, partial [Solirubrobacteraceae bacterium]|nr:glycerol-3-phosphate dehydrogenase [Solirubrobacteraceae bacterium]
MAADDAQVAVIGGGVVGCAVAHALARRGVAATVLEAERALALGASGTNSGILHTGFDSKPGELETELILRAAELRRDGSRLVPGESVTAPGAFVAALAGAARAGGATVRVDSRVVA